MPGEVLRSHLELMLLAVLVDAPSHGYAIIEALRQRSGGHLDVPEGTLYPALHRLERSRLVHSEWDTSAAPAGRRRRLYELTAAGRAALQQRYGEWQRFAVSMTRVLGESGYVE
jgi:PadR family transcriptional regulator, regulatory protein PadR